MPTTPRFVSLPSGQRVNKAFGVVTLFDMAWQLGRICRWVGGGTHFFSVMLHSFAVADMSPDRLKAYALVHELAECVGSDVPAPVKSDHTRALESAITDRTLSYLGLPLLNQDDKAELKRADNRALVGEAWVIGNAGHRVGYPMRDLFAEGVIRKYLKQYPYAETIERHGTGPEEFLRRWLVYVTLL